ncbi:DUF6580 family putative transport protein [Bdellovibrio reynosensis]|uniref:ECF transporter S component n=1 Tax=Bdellovibrio reynosensis TaxID=2835041 RepID=A0ABY4CC97_9BACT|nr:DUF6580 family putative transport protein [Bdellovibrio reynosensis]UOF02601.1 hypothetical protein MNR06_06515 [Bdellovibrio reynosensis]
MNQVLTLVMMVLVAAFSRLIPHPWNFTAIGAMALFGGAMFPSKKQSLVLPIAALFISDLVLGLHSTMVFVYFAFLAIVLLGWALRDNRSVVRVGTFALVSSSIFFLISNFGVWIMGGMYTPDFAGLVNCYVAAIPFFDNQIYGDLFFSGVLFGGYEVVRKFAPQVTVSN